MFTDYNHVQMKEWTSIAAFNLPCLLLNTGHPRGSSISLLTQPTAEPLEKQPIETSSISKGAVGK